MKKQQGLICAMIAVLFVSLLGYLVIWDKKDKVQYEIVVIGDSILGNEQGNTAVSNFIEEMIGKKTFNGALGGTCATVKENNANESSLIGALSLKNMTDAIVSEDFGQLNSIVNYGTKYIPFHFAILPYFYDRIKSIQEIDFTKVETLIISYGTNDFMQGGRVYNESETFDVKTLEGSLCNSIEILQGKYPNLEIVLTTPPNFMIDIEGEKIDGSTIKYGEYELKDYVDTILMVGETYNLKVVNLYEDFPITMENVNEYLFDGIHPSEKGRKMIAECITKKLLENE